MRVYIIGNDGITLCREAPTAVNDGEIAVASNEELHAANGMLPFTIRGTIQRQAIRMRDRRDADAIGFRRPGRTAQYSIG